MTREEAIKEIKSWDFLNEKETEAIETLIPELHESEDEKVRKAIMEVLKRVSGATDVLESEGTTFKKAMIWFEKQKAKERLDRMAPIYNDKESFESALEKAWKYYNESASRTVDSFEDDYIECVFSKGFREGFLYKEKQKEQEPVVTADLEEAADTYTNRYDDINSNAKANVAFKVGADWHGRQKLAESCDGICCGDDRFKIIEEAKKDIIEKTNIAENELSMELPLLDGILMRVWQVGWLNKKQKPAEWSKEDKKIVETICKEGDLKPSEQRWLKSLCPPQYCENCKLKRSVENWKPSEEQMKEYAYWYKNFIESGLASPSSKAVTVLGDLLEQLQKL